MSRPSFATTYRSDDAAHESTASTVGAISDPSESTPRASGIARVTEPQGSGGNPALYIPTPEALSALCALLKTELLQTLHSYAGAELHERHLRGEE